MKHVVVIGAGVSGCACAATLAGNGIGVTVMAPALDRVGEPAFGSVMAWGEEGVRCAEETVAQLPGGLRGAWQEALLVGVNEPVVVCDRRLVSIGVKRTLEDIAGVEFRQGLVVDIRSSDERDREGESSDEQGAGNVLVETAFGEVIRADAVVVAVGLSLGGEVSTGGTVVGSGRYGQPRSGGLEAVLGACGAEMRVVQTFLEAREGGPLEYGDGRKEDGVTGFAPMPLRRMGGTAAAGNTLAGPDSPYDQEELWTLSGLSARGAGGTATAVVVPDGLATGEVVLVSRSAGGGEARMDGTAERATLRETRPRYEVKGCVVTNVGDGGALGVIREGAEGSATMVAPVWVTGRAAGAEDYCSSLRSGMLTGEALAHALSGGCGRG